MCFHTTPTACRGVSELLTAGSCKGVRLSLSSGAADPGRTQGEQDKADAEADLPRGEPRGFAREGFWLGKVLIFHTEVFRVVLTDKPLWDRYLLRSQPSKPLTGQLRADGTLLGSIRSLFQEPGAKSNALLW